MKSLLLAALLLHGQAVVGATHTDPRATPETQNLYENLKALTTSDKVAFGQQFTTWRGVDADGTQWQGVPNKSDIKTMTGKFPAVCGWNVETMLKLAPADRANLIQRIKDDYTRNMIITFHWVMENPATGGSKKDTSGSKAGLSVMAQAITAGSVANKNLRSDLNDFAAFLNLLRDSRGRPIPIIFRPFHEMNGGGNWWSTGKTGNEADYVTLWRYVVSYLRDAKQIHQLLYVYAPSGGHLMKNKKETTHVGGTAAYLLNWPGNDFVDICGIDLYLRDGENVGALGDSGWNTALNFVYDVAQARSMPCAFTELGPKGGWLPARASTIDGGRPGSWPISISAPGRSGTSAPT